MTKEQQKKLDDLESRIGKLTNDVAILRTLLAIIKAYPDNEKIEILEFLVQLAASLNQNIKFFKQYFTALVDQELKQTTNHTAVKKVPKKGSRW